MGFRTDMRTAAFTLLQGFKTANPSLLQHIYSARPGSLHPPCAFIGSIGEPEIGRTAQIRSRAPRVTIFFVQGAYDNAETADRQDVIVDAFLDYADERIHAAGANTLTEMTSTEDVELEHRGPNGPVYYPATQVTLTGSEQTGGRWQ